MEEFKMEMTLYQRPQSRSDRVLWAVHEIGITDLLKTRTVELLKSEQNKEEFTTINHLRQVPALILRDPKSKEEHIMTESCAIPAFLVEATDSDLQPPISNAFARARYYRMMTLAACSIDDAVTAVVFNEKVAPEALRDPIAASKGRTYFKEKVLKVLNDVFVTKDGENPVEWVCEPYHKGFTIADCVVGFALILADLVNLLEDSPALKDYITRCKERPAYQAMRNSSTYKAVLEEFDIEK
eukprot:IDg20840t1